MKKFSLLKNPLNNSKVVTFELVTPSTSKSKIATLMFVIAIIMYTFVGFTACKDDPIPPKVEAPIPSLVGTKWKFTAFVDVENNTQQEPIYSNEGCPGYFISLIDDTTVIGNTCNNDQEGTYHIDYNSGKLSMGMGTTKVGEDGDMYLYWTTLFKVQSFSIAYTNPETLYLFYNDGKNSLKFGRVDNNDSSVIASGASFIVK